MISKENILIHEMIGLKTTIVDSLNHQIIGLEGNIIDETKSMFIIDTEKGTRMIPKRNNRWKFYLPNHEELSFQVH